MVSVSGALVMPPFRERLGTGCTKDSKDSGIDVRSTSKKQKKQRMKTITAKTKMKTPIIDEREDEDEANEEAKRNFENTIITILWCISIYFTNLSFGLPFVIMYPVRINHVAIAISYVFIMVWILSAFYFFIRKVDKSMRWHSTHPKKFVFAWICLFIGFTIFHLMTFAEIGNWSLVVCAIYFFFFVHLTTSYL